MSERDDERDKITVLFPNGDADPSESGEEDGLEQDSRPVDEETDEEVRDTQASDADADEDEERGENVVRLDFQRSSTRRSPRPERDENQEVSAEDRAKLEIFSEIIEEGMVMVTLDTRLPEVYVPPKFRGLPELRLNFSHLFQLSDFEYDTQGVRASLSFQGRRHFCDLPWAAVFMLYSHETGEIYIFDPQT